MGVGCRSGSQRGGEAAATAKKVCPVSGKAVDGDVKTRYEGKTYESCCEKCLAKFNGVREESLYQKIGGKPAMDAAIELFYKKVLADERISFYFEDVNMKKQARKQHAFLSAALNGPEPWTGKDMRKAHQHLAGLEAEHFMAEAENLQATLEELKVPEDLVKQVMAIAASTKLAVLGEEGEEEGVELRLSQRGSSATWKKAFAEGSTTLVEMAVEIPSEGIPVRIACQPVAVPERSRV